MDTSYLIASLLLLAVSVLLVAFFSSAEAGLIAASKIRIRHLAEQGNQAAESVQRVLKKHENFFASVVLTQDAFIILASSVGTALVIALLGEQGQSVLIATVTVTIVMVVFGEITPKAVALLSPERFSLLVARPIEVTMRLETPLLYILTLLPRLVSQLLGGKGRFELPTVTEGELRMLIDIGEAEGIVEESEAEMLEKVFRFGDRHVHEVMTPHKDMVWVERDLSLRQFLSIYQEFPHTLFPVYEGNIDNPVGVLSIKDLIMAQAKGQIREDGPIDKLVRPAHFVPETKQLGELFSEMRAEGNQSAIVVDEFGGTAGFVTLGQLVEEIVGHLGDELAKARRVFETIDENTFQVRGEMRIEEANEELGLGLPEGPYETVAGFALSVLGYIPKEGEQIKYPGLKLVITEMRGVKIAKLLVSKT